MASTLGSRITAANPKPITDLSGMFPGPDGSYWAVNPATGQPEAVVVDTSQSDMSGGNALNGAVFYFASDAPQGPYVAPLTVGQGNGIGDLLGDVASIGIGSMTGLGSVSGMSGSSAIGDQITGQDSTNLALGLDAAGAAATGAAVYGPGAVLTAAEDTPALIGNAVGDTLATMPAAVPETAASLSSMGLTETAPGVFTAAGTAGAAGAGSAVGSSLVSNATGMDPTTVGLAGVGAATGLGVLGATQAADAYSDAAAAEDARIREMMAFGGPYRDLLLKYTNDPNAFITSPGVTASVDQGTNALARSLSMTMGNPALSGTALHELQNYATNNLWGQYGAERDRLAGYGGLTAYAGGAARGPDMAPTIGGINANNNIYNAVGAGIADVTRPRNSLTDIMRSLT